jgi:hypothetical protein
MSVVFADRNRSWVWLTSGGGDMCFSLDIAASTFDVYNSLQRRASDMLLSFISRIIQDHSVNIQWNCDFKEFPRLMTCKGESGEGVHMETLVMNGERQVILYSICRENEVASSPASDVDHDVIFMNFLHLIFNMLPVFILWRKTELYLRGTFLP